MKKTFRITIAGKGSNKIWIKGQKPGVIGVKEFVYNQPLKDFKSPMFLIELLDQRESFINELFDIKTEEIT